EYRAVRARDVDYTDQCAHVLLGLQPRLGCADRFVADEQGFADGFVAHAAGQQFRDGDFAVGQQTDDVGGRADRRLGRGAIVRVHAIAGQHGFDGSHDFGDVLGFADVALRPSRPDTRRVQEGILRGYDQNAGVGPGLRDTRYGGQAVEPVQVQVEHYQAWSSLAHHTDGILPIAGFDDLRNAQHLRKLLPDYQPQ